MTAPTSRRLRLLLLSVIVALLTAVGLPTGAAHAEDYQPGWGSLGAPSGQLLRGCHTYTYTYALTPPPGNWALQTFITGPRGESVGSGAFLRGGDPESGTGTFGLCFPDGHSGTYTLNGLVTINQPGEAGYMQGFLPPTSFTLVKAKRDRHKVYTLGPVRIRR